MNSEARRRAEELAQGLRPRQVVAYNAKTGRVSVFRFGPNRKEEYLAAVGWSIVHRYTPPAIKAAVQAPAPAPIAEQPQPITEPKTAPAAKRGRPFSKTDKA